MTDTEKDKKNLSNNDLNNMRSKSKKIKKK